MNFDAVSLSLACTIAIFSYLVFILWAKATESKIIKKELKPCLTELSSIIQRNYLVHDKIPSKSQIISIIAGLSKEYNIPILTLQPIHEIIDILIYQIVSNTLIKTERKEMLTMSLIDLKNTPLNSEDYIQILSETENVKISKNQIFHSQLMYALIFSSIFTVIVSICFTKFANYWNADVLYFGQLTIIGCISFVALNACSVIYSVIQSLLNINSQQATLTRKLLTEQQKNTLALKSALKNSQKLRAPVMNLTTQQSPAPVASSPITSPESVIEQQDIKDIIGTDNIPEQSVNTVQNNALDNYKIGLDIQSKNLIEDSEGIPTYKNS